MSSPLESLKWTLILGKGESWSNNGRTATYPVPGAGLSIPPCLRTIRGFSTPNLKNCKRRSSPAVEWIPLRAGSVRHLPCKNLLEGAGAKGDAVLGLDNTFKGRLGGLDDRWTCNVELEKHLLLTERALELELALKLDKPSRNDISDMPSNSSDSQCIRSDLQRSYTPTGQQKMAAVGGKARTKARSADDSIRHGMIGTSTKGMQITQSRVGDANDGKAS